MNGLKQAVGECAAQYPQQRCQSIVSSEGAHQIGEDTDENEGKRTLCDPGISQVLRAQLKQPRHDVLKGVILC